MHVDPPRIEREHLRGGVDVGETLRLLGLQRQQPLLAEPDVRVELAVDERVSVVGDDEQHGAGGQRGHEGAEHVVQPAVEIEKTPMVWRRRVGVLVPEVVVEPITLGDDGDEEVPWLVADKA